MKVALYRKLSATGVVPLQLPKETKNIENCEDRKMALHLAEYEIVESLSLFCKLLRMEIQKPGRKVTYNL
jgi:hypothetical protein